MKICGASGDWHQRFVKHDDMKADELKSKIQFESRDVSHNLTMITATVQVHAIMEYDQNEVARIPKALDDIKEQLREMVMRHIYDDQRRDLYDALMELFVAAPMDMSAMSAAREKILNAARRQKPSA